MKRPVRRSVFVVVLVLLTSRAHALEITTSDGLALEFDNQTGAVTAIRIADQRLVQKGTPQPLRLRRFDAAESLASKPTAEPSGVKWKEIVLPPSPIQADGTSCGYSQRIAIPGEGLQCELRYLARKDHIRIETTVSDVQSSERECALQLEYNLPIDLTGWTWHDDGRRSRAIAADGPTHEITGVRHRTNAHPTVGGPVSRYPFTSITRGPVGLSLATPMDQACLQNFVADPTTGYRMTVDFGLSPHTLRIGPRKASFVTLLFQHDGSWGFRAAAQKYYAISPQHFLKRTTRDGAWFYVVRMSSIPHPEDFGPAIYEGFPRDPKERRWMREQGMAIFPYTEPWGARQVFPEVRSREEMPPLEERLRILRQWADDRTSSAKLLGGPRWEVAQAILNSLPYDDRDTPCAWRTDLYSHWSQWWMTNSNPRLPTPNRALTCRQYEIDRMLPEADGIYLDSVTIWLGNYLNYRRDHFAATDFPLAFDHRTGRPALLGMVGHVEFMTWLADDLHRQGKLLQMNLFPDVYRFCVHMADVLGCEVGTFGHRKAKKDPVTEDANDLLRRTLAYHKPTSNLLQEGNFHKPVPELTHEQIVEYLKRELFYGFFPGIATIGGEENPGYVGWKRYFSTPAQYERDREEFKRVVAAVRRLSAAGWEPVPWARTSNDHVWLERFGSWETDTLHYTLRNPGETPEQVTLIVDPAAQATTSRAPGPASAYNLLTGSPIPLTIDKTAATMQLTLTLAPRDTVAIRLQRNGGSTGP